MDFLRDNRIDAVEIGNFSNQEVENSFVIDRAGNLKNAKFIAQVLDIPERRVIQQMNKNYFLDATIVLGKDYKNLTPYRKK
jgi:hypothetical protein